MTVFVVSFIATLSLAIPARLGLGILTLYPIGALYLVLFHSVIVAALASRQTPSNSQIPANGNLELFAVRYKQVLAWELSVIRQAAAWLWTQLKQLGAALLALNPFQNRERNRFMLVIAWLIACSLDLFTLIACIILGTMILPPYRLAARVEELLLLGTILSGVNAFLSGIAAYGIHSGRFLPLVRAVSFLGIVPILPDCFFRIPLSIITLLWLRPIPPSTVPPSANPL